MTTKKKKKKNNIEWKQFFKQVYNKEICYTLKKATKQLYEKKDEWEWHCLKGDDCKIIWNNLRIGFILYWLERFKRLNQSQCNQQKQKMIKLILSKCFPYLLDTRLEQNTHKIWIKSIDEQLTNLVNIWKKKVLNNKELNRRQDVVYAFWKQEWIPNIDFKKVLKHWAFPRLTDNQIDAFKKTKPVYLLKGNDYSKINVACFLNIFYENDGLLFPTSAQLTHFQNTFIQINIDDKSKIYKKKNNIVPLEFKVIDQERNLNKNKNNEFVENEWNDIDWKQLKNEHAMISLNDCDKYIEKDFFFAMNEERMMYLMQLNLKKLYYFLKTESDRLFEYIKNDMTLIYNKKYTTNIWTKFEDFMNQNLNCFCNGWTGFILNKMDQTCKIKEYFDANLFVSNIDINQIKMEFDGKIKGKYNLKQLLSSKQDDADDDDLKKTLKNVIKNVNIEIEEMMELKQTGNKNKSNKTNKKRKRKEIGDCQHKLNVKRRKINDDSNNDYDNNDSDDDDDDDDESGECQFGFGFYKDYVEKSKQKFSKKKAKRRNLHIIDSSTESDDEYRPP